MLPDVLKYEETENGTIRFTDSEREYHAVRKGNGRPVVTLRRDGVILGSDRVDLGSAKARREFASTYAAGNEDAVERELLILGQLTLLSGAGDAGDAESPRYSQADLLVQLAAEVELFHDATGEAYATIRVDNHFENHRLRTKGFRRWLARAFYERHGKAPGSQAMQDALTVIEGTAIFERSEEPVFIRIGHHGSALYIDLGDEHWRAVEIDANGWRLVERAPVKFIRSRGMLPLPAPVEGGHLSEFRELLNFGDDDQAAWTLLQGWIVGALRPEGPYAVLVLQGEQGSSKSTVSRFLKATIDPSAAPIRSEPREQRDLVIAASANRLLAFDNLSYISPTLSDGLCRLSTGGGFATRELYSDTDETILDVQRPVILNGIEELVTRADLLDRCIILELPAIPPHRRRPERDLWAAFNAMLPRFLGALYEAVSTAIRELPGTQLDDLPRLADFALWVAAAESSLDMEHGDFLAAYAENRSAANELTLGAAVIAEPVRSLIEREGRWVGTASGLLQTISDIADERAVRGKQWPKTPHALSNQLRRIEPNLRAIGISLAFERRAQGKRIIIIERLERAPETASPASPASPQDEDPHVQAKSRVTRATDGASPITGERHHASPSDSASTSQIRLMSDAGDASDAEMHPDSKDTAALLADLRGWYVSGLLFTFDWPLEYEPGRRIERQDFDTIVNQCKEALARPETAQWGDRMLRAIHAEVERRITEVEAA